MLNHNSPIPLYYQLEELLRHNIEQGNWLPGSILPSEKELCETYRVSRGPVRQAIKNLEIAGLTHAVQGKGVIVNQKKFQPNLLANTSFFKEIERQGMKPTSEVIKKEIAQPAPPILHQLSLNSGAEIFLVQRVIKGDGLPLALATTYLPALLFPGFLEIDLTETALYDLITKVYKIRVNRVQEKFEPVLPNPEEKALLNLSEFTPSLLVHRVIHSPSAPVDYTTILVRGDRCLYTLEIPVN